MADRILLVMAKRAGRWIAGAINFVGSDTLFGRHWGAVEHHPFLHFEVCYYQAIDYAIAHKLAKVEAGAQGEHKIARGYLPAHDLFLTIISPIQASAAPWQTSSSARAPASSMPRKSSPGRPRSARAETGLRTWRCAAAGVLDADLRSQQHLRQDPARRAARLQGLRGRPRLCLPRHHAALAGPYAGDPQGPGPQSLLDIQPDDLAHVSKVAQKIAKAGMLAFAADGITIQQFNEGAGGQVVFHLHVHVMPRKDGVALEAAGQREGKAGGAGPVGGAACGGASKGCEGGVHTPDQIGSGDQHGFSGRNAGEDRSPRNQPDHESNGHRSQPHRQRHRAERARRDQDQLGDDAGEEIAVATALTQVRISDVSSRPRANTMASMRKPRSARSRPGSTPGTG